MDLPLSPKVTDEFSPEDIVNMSSYVDDCRCQCRTHFTVQDGLINVHGRPIYDRLMIQGDLSLSGNEDIRRLPDLLAVTGSIDLSGCSNLEVMPSRMYAGNVVRLDETNIRELPRTLEAGLAVYVEECPNIRSIPEGVRTCSLHGAGCAQLTKVAEGLEFNTLDLSETPVEGLPSALTIKNELKLRDCFKLARIPEGITIGGAIDVRGCDLLFTLPRSVQPGVVVTDGMMLAHDWVVVPQMTAEEASMCLGAKAIQAFPHRHLKNIARMQDAVVAVDREEKGLCRGRAVGALKSGAMQRPHRDLIWRLITGLHRRGTHISAEAEVKRIR